MTYKSIHISIPKPCQERWEAMDATERGAFCHSCQKEVIDFSAMTDREVIEYLTKYKDSCGKFRSDQLHTGSLTIPRIKNGFLKWKALAFACFSMLTIKNVLASKNRPVSIQITDTKSKADTTINTVIKNIRIEGRIEDDSTGLPLPYTTLSLTTLSQSRTEFIQVDSMGKFSFETDFHSDGFGLIYLYAHHVGYAVRSVQVLENASTVQRFVICLRPAKEVHFNMGKVKINH